MPSRLPTTALLGFTEEALHNLSLHNLNEDLSHDMREWLNDLWFAFYNYPEATEHMRALTGHISAMYRACEEKRLEDAEQKRLATLPHIGSLYNIAARHQLP